MEKTIKVLLDDIDGTEATRHIRFSVDGTNYEIDLGDSNAESFDKALAPFIAAGRRVGRFSTGQSTPRAKSKRDELAKIRAWARENGYSVSDRGRVAQSIQDAYHAAH